MSLWLYHDGESGYRDVLSEKLISVCVRSSHIFFYAASSGDHNIRSGYIKGCYDASYIYNIDFVPEQVISINIVDISPLYHIPGLTNLAMIKLKLM